ncbi:copper-binding protein [Vibrio sp. vnigr-6D03]|uniref:copper-resistant cuproprotein CopI n=1 Tax=Vibrio TaxID=662 RepID=UPI000C344331|nr:MULTISPECIES: cupredoxin family protein [Vibrio]MDP2571808.1 copper-binding protein [Vibrio penaeicida]PKF81504.1 copper-binding protein [Vibrio sp. vnigr-6D03]
MKKSIIALALSMVASGAIAAGMDHSKMDHSKMDHSKMDHSNMMNMEGMSDVGMPAKGAKPDKVVHVILSDDMTIKFKKEVNIEPNDVVQFVVINTGKIDHEFAIGSVAEQKSHREMMKKKGHHNHDSGSVVTVKPGKAKQLTWHFHGDSNIEFACNIAGHYEAGMVKSIQI